MTTTLLIAARAFHFGSGMILVGVMAFRWLVWLPAFAGEASDSWLKFTPFLRRLNQLFAGAGIVLVISGVALFWAVTAGMSDSSLAEALQGDVLSTVFFHTQFGTVCQWRLGLAVLLGLLMVLLIRKRWYFERRRSWLETAAGLVAGALLVSIAWTGHAAASGGAELPWRITIDAFHLLSAAVWPTGLLPFSLFLRRARELGGAIPSRPVHAALGRFSNLSLAVVVLLIATGILNTLFLVGSFSALVTTVYGRILCLKLGLLALILGLAAWNRFRLLPLLFARREMPAEGAEFPILRRLQSFVAAEFGLAVGIMVVVSVLGITPPPR